MKKVSEVFKVGKNKIGWVGSDFTKEFGKDDMPEMGVVLQSQKLTRSMTDSEIIKELGVQECTLADVLVTLESATEDMKDGYWNLFYIKGHPSLVVRVYWLAEYGRWFVDVWHRDDHSWFGGLRVFSPATEARSLGAEISTALNLDEAIKICKDNGLKVIRIKTIEEEL